MRKPALTRLSAVFLSALAGGTLAHLAAGGPAPAASATTPNGPTDRAAREGAPTEKAEPESLLPPEPVEDEPHAEPTETAEPGPAPRPRPRDPMGSQLAEGRVITGATPHRLILFTFDDGPDPRYTPDLLDILDEHGIRAVFFLTAAQIQPDTPWGRRQAELAREIARRGHLIGNHTVNHAQLPLLNNNSVTAQLTESERIFERVFGARPWLFRPPGGARSKRVDGLVESRGYTQVMWNLGTGDFQVRSPGEVLETWKAVFERRQEENGERGGVVLLHDIHEWSVQAVPLIVQEIRRRNCRLLERGEELYDIVDDPRLFFAAREPGDEWGTAAPPARPSERVLAERQARLRAEAERYCD